VNTQVNNDSGSAPIKSGQVDAVASDATVMHRGGCLLTTHEFEHQGDNDWLLTQRCYTHTGITFVPLKSYEIHGISDKRAALQDAEQHILSSGGRKGQWCSNTPSAVHYDVPNHIVGDQQVRRS
jgi:hypothetical protein